MYQVGKGVQLDLAEAAKWYKFAADQGDALSQAVLGAFYYTGTGVKQDYVEAARLARLAADQGNDNGQILLGLLYQLGLGVEKDGNEAARLYRLAEKQGNLDATNSLGALYLGGIGLSKDESEAIRLFRIAADKGNSGAKFSLGVVYKIGIFVPRNRIVASALLKLAESDSSLNKMATELQAELSNSISSKEMKVAGNLSREMNKPGNLLKAMDGYLKKPLIKESSQGEAANNDDITLAGNGQKKRLELFGQNLKGATRDQLRGIFKQNGLQATREEDSYWVDTYQAEGVLEGANEFHAGYVAASGKFAFAEYTFPGFMDLQLVGKVIDMVSTKYGRPSSQKGNYGLGKVEANWNMGQEMQVVVSRGWPDTTTTLQFIDLSAQRQMKAEIDFMEKSQATQKAKSQSNAF
jgi:TPR repeat protein